jgi:potassium/hydrogen antiporter
MQERHERALRSFTTNVTDLLVIFIFVVLGANLPLDSLSDEAAPALITLAVLILVARPATVVAALLLDRRGQWRREEIAFVAWTKETGVVPAALAGVVIAEGVPYEDEIITVVALAVIVTLVLQASTKPWLARRLGLEERDPNVDRREAAVP